MIRFEFEDTDGQPVPMVARAMARADINYVRNSWFKNHRPSASVGRNMFARNHPSIIDEILDSDTASTVIATSEEAPDTIHAWACGEIDGPLHYAYVTPELRGRGIARELIKVVLGRYPNHIEVTHRFIGRPDSRRFTFNPYILRVFYPPIQSFHVARSRA